MSGSGRVRTTRRACSKARPAARTTRRARIEAKPAARTTSADSIPSGLTQAERQRWLALAAELTGHLEGDSSSEAEPAQGVRTLGVHPSEASV